MRALKILIVAMGLLIVLGVVGLVGVIASRMSTRHPLSPDVPVLLAEPAGTRIAGITATGDTLAVQLQGGGPDRVVIVDPHSLHVLGRIALTP